MKEEELKELGKNIPITVLREKFPDLHKRPKQPFIDKLYNENRQELKSLAEYHSLIRKKSVFFIHVKKDVLPRIKEYEGRRIEIKDIDNIFEIKEVIMKCKNEYIVKVEAHSRVISERLEEPITLKTFPIEYRRHYSISFICYLDTSMIQVFTRSESKIFITMNLIKHIFEINDEDLEKKVFGEQEQKRLKDDIYYKEVVFSGLNYAGSEVIIIKGPNVKKTIDTFKENGTDLVKLAGDTKFIKSEMTKQPISFHQSGKISFSRKIKDVYKYLKKVLTKNVK